MAAHPINARVRTIPMSANPDPMSAPFPVAADPDESWIGPGRNNLDSHRRRFARLFHDNFASDSGMLHDDDAAWLTFDDATGEQWQAGGD